MNSTGECLSWVGVALVTLVPIINPVSTAFLLLGIGSHFSEGERNKQITRACIYMTGILIVFLLVGHLVMAILGISIPGIRIVGGFIIGFLGFRMLFPKQPLEDNGFFSHLHRRPICDRWCRELTLDEMFQNK